MGLLGKYLAFRWLSRGPGGPNSGDDGGGELALVFLIVGGTIAVFLVVGYVLTGIGSFIYDTVRPVLLVAPKVSAVLGGVFLSSVVLVVPGYSPETARKVLISGDTDGGTGDFYIRNSLIVCLMFVIGSVVATTGGELPSALIAGYTGNPLVHLVVNLVYIAAFFYVLYKFFHLPYRYHRLLRHSPYGTVYTIGTLFPITSSLVISLFDLPVEVVDAPLSSVIAVVFLSSLLLIPYALPLVFVKRNAEPRILGYGNRESGGG